MPDLEYFLVARGLSIDQFSNGVTIFEVIDQMTPRRFPALIPRMVALAGWNVTQQEIDNNQMIDSALSFRLPGQQQPMDCPLAFQAMSRRHRNLANYLGVPLTEPGEIEFELRLNGQPVAHHRILINPADAQAVADGWLLYQTPPPADTP